MKKCSSVDLAVYAVATLIVVSLTIVCPPLGLLFLFFPAWHHKRFERGERLRIERQEIRRHKAKLAWLESL